MSAEFCVVRKGKYFITRPIGELAALVANGMEEVKDYQLVRTTSSDLYNPEGFKMIAVPIGIDPMVVKTENMYPASLGKPADELPVYGEIVIVGANDPFPDELLATTMVEVPKTQETELVPQKTEIIGSKKAGS